MGKDNSNGSGNLFFRDLIILILIGLGIAVIIKVIFVTMPNSHLFYFLLGCRKAFLDLIEYAKDFFAKK